LKKLLLELCEKNIASVHRIKISATLRSPTTEIISDGGFMYRNALPFMANISSNTGKLHLEFGLGFFRSLCWWRKT